MSSGEQFLQPPQRQEGNLCITQRGWLLLAFVLPLNKVFPRDDQASTTEKAHRRVSGGLRPLMFSSSEAVLQSKCQILWTFHVTVHEELNKAYPQSQSRQCSDLLEATNLLEAVTRLVGHTLAHGDNASCFYSSTEIHFVSFERYIWGGADSVVL